MSVRVIPIGLSTAAAIAALTACSDGRVKTEAIGSFGGASGVWLDVTQDSPTGQFQAHRFVLTSEPGYCRKVQKAYPEMGEAYTAFLDTIVDNPLDTELQCQAEGVYLQALADASSALLKGDAAALSLTIRDPNMDQKDVPPDGTYVHEFDGERLYWSGAVTEYTGNPWQIFAEQHGCTSGDWEIEAYNRVDEIVEVYTTDGGTVTAEQKGDKAFRLEVSGDLNSDQGRNAGTLDASGRFKRCEVRYEGEPLIWF